MLKVNIENIEKRVAEVKSLFTLGQQIMPIIEELFQFILEMNPLMDDINRSISESSSKMPKAADKIINISNATELATSEILDNVDAIFITTKDMEEKFNENVKLQTTLLKKLIINIKKLDPNEKTKPQINTLLKISKEMYKQTLDKNKIEHSNQNLEKLNNLANKILMTLQFQDITSQQLKSANFLISQVHNKLGSLLSQLGDSDFEKMIINPGEFNENAEFHHNAEKQQIADDMLEKANKNDKTEDVDDIISQLENENNALDSN